MMALSYISKYRHVYIDKDVKRPTLCALAVGVHIATSPSKPSDQTGSELSIFLILNFILEGNIGASASDRIHLEFLGGTWTMYRQSGSQDSGHQAVRECDS